MKLHDKIEILTTINIAMLSIMSIRAGLEHEFVTMVSWLTLLALLLTTKLEDK